MKNNRFTKAVIVACFLVTQIANVGFASTENQITPTLDELNNAGITMPNTGNVYPKSAYSLEKTNSTGINIITTYIKSETDNTLIPQYYKVNLKNTIYGHPNAEGAEEKIFTVTTPNPTGGNAFEYDITYYADPSRKANARIDTDLNGADINKDFIELKIESADKAFGGAIYNESGTIGDITGDFIGNYASATAYRADAYGGAIYNTGTIGDITGDFIGNYASAADEAFGGAIYNESGNIGNITGDFIGNYASATADYAAGGAIANGGTIGNITGDFIGNYASSTADYAYGGAIYNTGTIGDITGDFIGNYASNTADYAAGGAIANGGTIGDITGDFIGNYASATADEAFGGAIYNESGNIGNITGDFIGNYASATADYAYGGAIYNESGNIGNITGDFIGNYASAASAETVGGAIANTGTIGDITGDFIGNYASNTAGYAAGGAIANVGIITSIKNSSFINNFAESTENKAYGGAILSTGDLNIIADNGVSIFSGNKTISSDGVIEQNAISIDASLSGAKLTLTALNNGIIRFDDTINGVNVSTGDKTVFDLSITGDNTGKVILNNYITEANLSLDNTNLYLGKDDLLNNSNSLTLNSGFLSLANSSIGAMEINNFAVNGGIDLALDVDLANKTMDSINSTEISLGESAALNVNYINLLSDSNDNQVNIKFTDNPIIAEITNYTGTNPIALSPIYKYNISYDKTNGMFGFSRFGGGSDYNSFNPAVMASPIAAQLGGYLVQLHSYEEAFHNMDMYMLMTKEQRNSMKFRNRYATINGNDITFDPTLNRYENKAGWVRPYATFENVPLNNGPKVSNVAYGMYFGADSELYDLGHGWDGMLSLYAGYNGSHQAYNNIGMYQNGGSLGITGVAYKGNFFTGLTANVGANVGQADTMYGQDDFAMLLSGVASKTGYNWELVGGKLIIQPNLLMSYSFVNTFDYTNAAGISISSDPLHAIQLEPGIKIIGNLKDGWQPYLGVSMVWNIMDNTQFMANNVSLPSLSVDPYVKYGVGVRKSFGERLTGFLQTYFTNGGRNGVGLQTGFRFSFGKESNNTKKQSKTPALKNTKFILSNN